MSVRKEIWSDKECKILGVADLNVNMSLAPERQKLSPCVDNFEI